MKYVLSLLLITFMSCNGDYCHKALMAEKKITPKMKNWSEETSKLFNLILLCDDGSGTLIDGDDQTFWCSKFMIQSHKMTIEDMRPIIEKVYQSLWKMAKEEKAFKDFVLFTSKLISRFRPNLTPGHIGIRIDLWDENNDRYLSPYVSQAIVTGNQVYYYYADPETQALQKPGVVEDLAAWVIGE